MDYTAEVQDKLGRVRQLLKDHQIGAIWLRRVDNIAWLTGGLDTAVNTADVQGIASLVVTATSATLFTNTIEAPRLKQEDRIEERGFTVRFSAWETPQPVEIGSTLATDLPLEGALDLSGELVGLRSALLPVEIARFRRLGQSCAEAMQAAIQRTRPGLTEFEIAGIVAGETYRRGARPIVVLVATDERIAHYRHPLPTSKVMDRYAMLVLCGRQDGLVCSITRLVHYGPLPDDLRRKMHACADVDAAMIAASQAGATLDAIFQTAQAAYARAGFDGEWKLHHQGGTAAYNARELLAVPGEKFTLAPGMVCAWNPSITGVKSEDTILVPEAGGTPDILTAIDGWPTQTVTVGGMTLARPLILEVG